MPNRTSEIPKVHRLAVRDEEGLSIHTLRVKRDGRNHPVGDEESLHSEKVSERDVLHVRKVEEILVRSHLELCLPLAVGADHGGDELDVALAEDTRWPDGAGEEVSGGAVRLQDSDFGKGLGRGVVFWLAFAVDHGPIFRGVYELGFGTEDDAGGGGVDEGFDGGFLRGLEEVLGALDVYFVLDGGGHLEVGGGRVDYGVGLELLEEFLDEWEVGDVGVVVGDLRGGMAVRGGAEVEHGDGSIGMALDDQGHNVGAKEAAAANYRDVSEGGYRLWTGRHGGSMGWCRSCCGRAEVMGVVPQVCGPRANPSQGLGT